MFRGFLFRAVVPTFLTIFSFVVAIFFIVIPSFEQNILDQKREMIRELTNSAWNILAKFEQDERNGALTKSQAQDLAISQIRTLHYGQQMKDYFWVNDMNPTMVFHPYRADLNGKDLSEVRDPNGKRLFVEFVKVVREQGAGFVDYMWQWKDDSSRVVPKLSFVKGFQPWGWVIGTGVYIDDVQLEIKSMSHRLWTVSLLILTLASFFLFFLLREAYLAETLRRQAEQALRKSEEKYRTLVESTGERILMVLGSDRIFANQSMLQFLGYGPDELGGLSVDQIILLSAEERRSGVPYFHAVMNGDEHIPMRYETSLRAKDGSCREVTLSLSPLSIQGKKGFIAVAGDLTGQRAREKDNERLLADFQAELAIFNRTAGSVCSREVPQCVSETSIGGALGTISGAGAEAAVVREGESVIGVVCAAKILDLVSRDAGALQKPIGGLVERNPRRIPGEATLAEAWVEKQTRPEDPLFVTGGDGAIIGMMRDRDFVQMHAFSAGSIWKGIRDSKTVSEMIGFARRLPSLVGVLVETGLNPFQVNRIITATCDEVLRRSIKFGSEELGPPPVPFSFLVMGSQGRVEQTLRTDQDNAIIFSDPPPREEERVQAFFEKLGSHVCEILDKSGYSFCDGKIMAGNPQWCKPLSVWKSYFERWVRTLEARDLLETKVFFDFRSGAGDARLADDLRIHLATVLKDSPRFFFLLARNVLRYEPPVSMFGNFVLEHSVGSSRAFDIKGVMAQVVDFARIYALKHGVFDSNTPARLSGLLESKVFTPASFREISRAYEALMQLRLKNQVRAIRENQAPDNLVVPEQLTSIDQLLIKEVFSQIKNFQVRLSYDFTGTLDNG